MKKLSVLLFISLLIVTPTSAATTISTDITTTGKVGIGSTTPYAKLSIDATQAPTGPELITNGTFTGGTTGWTLGNNVSYGDNNVVSTYVGGDPSLSTTFDVVSGRTYIINYTISNASLLAYAYLYLSGGESYYESIPSKNSTYTVLYKATITGSVTLSFDDWNYVVGDIWTLDDVSIKETSTVITPLKVIGNNGKNIFNLGEDLLGNLSIGNSSFSSNTTGSRNTSYGHGSLTRNTTGGLNDSFGHYNLSSNTTGAGNSAMGAYAMYTNTTGAYNSALGFYSLSGSNTASYNVGVGYCTLCSNVTGTKNVAIGYASSLYNISATSTTVIGAEAALGTARYSNQGGVYLGYRSGFSAGNSSDYNTLIGYQSGYGITTGKNNIVLGTATSSTSVNNITTGSQNILIGNNIGLPSSTASGQLNIGNIIYGTGITTTGTTMSSGKIGIGTTSPLTRFHVTSGASATTTSSFGEVGSATSKACFNTKNTAGADISFYFVGTSMVVESNLCR